MCDWLTLAFAAGFSFCSAGRFESGCTPEQTDGVYLGMAKHLQLSLVPGEHYYLLTDARSPKNPSLFSLSGGRFISNLSTPIDELEGSFDPWSASAFLTVGTFEATAEKVVVTLPDAGRDEQERAAVCPKTAPPNHRPTWLSLLTLPSDRTKAKLFSKTLVYPTLPIPIGALVLAYLQKDLTYRNFLVILFYTDGIWWLTNSISSSELSGVSEDVYLPLLLSLAGFFLAALFLKTSLHLNLFVLLGVAVVALLTSPFYYTPLALVVSPIWFESPGPSNVKPCRERK